MNNLKNIFIKLGQIDRRYIFLLIGLSVLIPLLKPSWVNIPIKTTLNSEIVFNELNKLNKELPAETIQATLLKLTAVTITDAIKQYANGFTKVLVCGGGVNNPLLIKNIQGLLANIKVTTTSEYGLSPDCIEAVTFAWLAKKRLDNKSANIPDVTGANKNVILGGVYAPNKEKD